MNTHLNGKLALLQVLLGSCLLILLSLQTVNAAPRSKNGDKNNKPIVSLLSPQSGMTFLVGESIRLVAQAEDSDGFIESLAFYRDAELIAFGELSNGNEWQTLWSDIPLGNYSLFAIAKDSGGLESISEGVEISVVEQASNPLEVEIIEPLDQSTVHEGEVLRLIARIVGAHNSVQSLQLFNGNQLMQTNEVIDGNEDRIFEFFWTAENPGFHALTIAATDKNGKEFFSMPLRINVMQINKNPMVSIVSPDQCMTYESFKTLHFQADAFDIDGDVRKLEFFIDGNLIGEDNTQPFSVIWSGIFSGYYQLKAKAIDNYGAATLSQALQFYVEDANVFPSITITQPVNNSLVKNESELLLVAEAIDDDGYIEKVVFYQDSDVIATLLHEPYEFLWKVPRLVGDYVITAKAIDNKSASTTANPVSINVIENAAPEVLLTSPKDGNVYEPVSSLQLIATASDTDGYISSVSFYQNSLLLYEDYSEPYEFLWEGIEAGSYQLKAIAMDDEGALTTSGSVNVEVVSQTAMNVILESPRDGEKFSLASDILLKASVELSSNDIKQVEFYADEALIGLDSSYPYEFVWRPMDAGKYVVSAKAMSNSGLSVYSSQVMVSVLAEELQLSISSIQEGDAVFDSVVLVEGDFNAPENSGVSINGIVASSYQNKFYANVPVEAGLNIIEAVLTTQTGHSISKSISVHGLAPPSSIEIQVSTDQVLTPFTKALTLLNHGAWNASVEINGLNTYELLAGESLELSLVGTEAGVYRYQLRIMDEQGMLMVRDIAFVALHKSDLDAMLRRNWLTMTNDLSHTNIEAALSFFSDSSKNGYASAFNLLAHKMPQIVSGFSPLQSSHLRNDYAEYAVNQTINGEKHLFFIYYTKDSQGIWRIQSM